MMNDGYANVPLGFGMGLVMDDHAKQRYESLSEAEKEDIILRCKDAKSKDEMAKIINSVSSPGEIEGLLGEENVVG